MSRILLVGNSNAGKTSLFNKLTGLNQKVGNFHGVTVTSAIGTIQSNTEELEIIDLPGSFSLNSYTEDKKVLTNFLIQRKESDRILFILDASQLERSLQFFYQVKDLGVKICLVLTMKDILEKKNTSIDLEKLSTDLKTRIFLINAKTGEGVETLKNNLFMENNFQANAKLWKWEAKRENLKNKILKKIDSNNDRNIEFILSNALKKLSGESIQSELPSLEIFPSEIQEIIKTEFKKANLKFTYQEEVLLRASSIKKILSRSLFISVQKETVSNNFSFDRIFLHPIAGLLIFFLLMLGLFQLLFSVSKYPMEQIEFIFDRLSDLIVDNFPAGALTNLISKGIITGIGSVLIFIPQIAFLFFSIGVMEETGYLSRILFLMDKFMGKFGLSGRSFLPLISSAACAVPAILSTRTIENKSEKIITILISPLVTCSARYPVYILIIGSIFPNTLYFGFLSLHGLILFTLFLLGILTALFFAVFFRRVFFKSANSFFLLEIPSFRMPSLYNLFQYTYQNVKSFVINSGKIILLVSILLWFLANFPNQNKEIKPDIEKTYIAKMGKFIEPIIEPIGFNWKIGVGIISSFAAREVMVSTLAILYNVDSSDEGSLKDKMKNDKKENGEKLWDTLTSISLLIFFAYASQCMSTLAVTRQETNSYFWAFFSFFYMLVLAYSSCFIFFQIGKLFIR